MPASGNESNSAHSGDVIIMEKESFTDPLAKVEEVSDSYLDELTAKLSDLRQKMHDEKMVNGQLQEMLAGLQGKIAVHYDRCKELGIENFQEMMVDVKAELENAKLECDQCSCELFVKCKKVLEDIEINTSRYEEIRTHFEDEQAAGVDRSNSEADTTRCEELSNDVQDINSKINQLQQAKEHVLNTLQNLDGSENLMDYFQEELQVSDLEIAFLTSKLQSMQPNVSG